jgi:hypothetical protein
MSERKVTKKGLFLKRTSENLFRAKSAYSPDIGLLPEMEKTYVTQYKKIQRKDSSTMLSILREWLVDFWDSWEK